MSDWSASENAEMETSFDGDVKDIANEERLEIELRFQQDISNFAENLFDKNKYPNLLADTSVTVSLPSEKNYAGGLDGMDNDGRVCEIPADTNKNKTNIEKGKWFSGINPGKNSLDTLIEKICEDCGINIGKRHVVNRSMKTTDIIQLTKLGVPFNEIMMLNNVSSLIDSESSSSPEKSEAGIKADVESCNEDVDDCASSTVVYKKIHIKSILGISQRS
nr:9682_t:CDS:2 [Entrophospora candida]